MSDTEDCDYTWDMKSMQEAQLDDKRLKEIVKKHLSCNGNNDTVYTYKSVEDVELIHQNNQILVSKSEQQRVLD